MARTIQEIKRGMTEAYIADPTIISAYGLKAGKTFEEQFSRVSLESILFYVFASAVWLLEQLYDRHRGDIQDLVAQSEPHTVRWYARKAKEYIHGARLIPNTDRYDISSYTPEQLDAARPVRYASAVAADNVLWLKVAGAGSDGQPQQLTQAQEDGLHEYLSEVKDAGVVLKVIQQSADQLSIQLKVYVLHGYIEAGEPSVGITDAADRATRSVVRDLPFDGVLRSSDIVDSILKIDGVAAAHVVRMMVTNSLGSDSVEGYHRPRSGYYKIVSLNISYAPYDTRSGL